MEPKVTLDRGVLTVLNGIGLEKYIPLFEKHQVDMVLFVSLTEEDLKSLGIEDQGELELLIKYIKKFQYTNVSEELEPLRQEEIFEVLKNTSTHLHAIDVASSYVCASLKNDKPIDFLVNKDKSITSAISLFCSRIESETDGFIADIDRMIETIQTKPSSKTDSRKRLTYCLTASTLLVSVSIAAFLSYKRYLK